MRVLAVDDDPITLKIVSKSLSGAGYDVFTARDGQEALAQVESVHPDLIILDVMLPGIDGYEVLRRVQRMGATRAFVGGYSVPANALYRSVMGDTYDLDEVWVKDWPPDEVIVSRLSGGDAAEA